MRSTTAAIIQPHRAHATTRCAYIEVAPGHSTQRYGEDSTFQYLNTHIRHRCGSTPVSLRSALHLSWWEMTWAVPGMERARSVAALCYTRRNATAAIIQPHRAHASTWCAYIDTYQRHPHAFRTKCSRNKQCCRFEHPELVGIPFNFCPG